MSAAIVDAPPTLGLRGVIRIPNYRLLWFGQVVSDIGDSLTLLSLLITVNRLTGSTAALALMTIVTTLPQVTLGLVAGVYVDRLDRRRIMILSDLTRGLLVLGFVAATQMNALWLLYLIAFAQASVGTLFTPARSAIIPDLVPKEGLLAANSFSQSTRVAAGVIGSAGAGIMFGIFDTVWPAFLIDACTFFFSVAMISQIHGLVTQTNKGGHSSAKVILSQMLAGLRLIPRSNALLGTFIGVGIGMLGFGMVNILILPLIINDLKLPPTWFGAIDFAQVVSMILSSAIVGIIATRFKPTAIQSVCLFLLGIIISLTAFSPNIFYLMGLIFLIGWLVTPLQAAATTILQTSVEAGMRGRIAAAFSTVSATASVLSAAFAGIFGDLLGVRNGLFLGGVLVIFAGIVTFAIFTRASRQGS